MSDIRYALRSIRRMPGLAAVVVLSLGIGIGVNTVVFSWMQLLLFNPLPGVKGGGNVHLIEPRGDGGGYPGLSWLETRDLRERLRSFRGLVASRIVPFNVGEASRVERTFGQLVSGNYFSELGVQPAFGRLLGPDDEARIGGEPVVVVSYSFWESRLACAPNAIGQTIRVNNRPLTIVGITPPRFQGTVLGLQFDIWVPATMAQVLTPGSRELEDRSVRGYSMMGLLRPSVTRAQAQAEVSEAMRELARVHPETNRGLDAEVITFWSTLRGPQRMLFGALAILQAVMLLLLVAVCGNTATLILARASERHREVGIRLAAGAGRARIVRLILTENVILAVLGSALGVAIAWWGTDALRAAPMPMPAGFSIRMQTQVDLVTLAFAILLGLACGAICGAAPALQLSGVDPARALRAGARLAAPSALRSALMGVQIALALIVLVVAALFLRNFVQTGREDTGFRKEGVLLAAYDLTGRVVDDRTFAARVLASLRELPGIESAAIATSVPLDIHGLPSRTFTLEGRARTDGGTDRAASNTVTPGYFRTMAIPFRTGSDFADLDDVIAPPQAIVNEAFVDRYLQKGEPIGRRVTSGRQTYIIIGVVRTSLSDSFGEPPTPAIYFSYRDRPTGTGEMHLRTRPGREAAIGADVKRALHAIDPALPIFNLRTLTEHIDKNLFLRRIPARMFAVLGPLLLALAAIGIYGVVAHIVSHRTPEIGVRLALGATARRVVVQIVGESFRAIGLGAFCGWVLACVITFDLLDGGTGELPILLGIPALLLLVAACACWLPARRAAAIDPWVALRQD
jgi:predicted permease